MAPCWNLSRTTWVKSEKKSDVFLRKFIKKQGRLSNVLQMRNLFVPRLTHQIVKKPLLKNNIYNLEVVREDLNLL